MMEQTPLSPIFWSKTMGNGSSPAPVQNAVLYTEQTLTAAQQAQARANIGATDAETSIPDNVKSALLDCFANVAWATEDGQQYYDALEAALYPLDHITAVYTQSGTVYDTDSLDSLKTDLVVTAVYEGGNTETVPAANYTLNGTLTEGTSTITVNYGGKTATFDVTVSESPRINDILTLDGILNTRSGHSDSATTWEDLSGNNYDFEKVGVNSPVFANDHAVYDATDRRLHLSADLYGHRTTWTLEFVVSVTGNGSKLSNTAYYGGLFSNRNAENSNGLSIYTYNAAGVSAYYKQSESLGYTGSLGNTIGYIAYVFNNGTVRRYKNGVFQSSSTLSTFATDNKLTDFYIGTGFVGFTDAFPSANIYRIGMSSTAMTDEEIASRYAFFANRFNIA